MDKLYIIQLIHTNSQGIDFVSSPTECKYTTDINTANDYVREELQKDDFYEIEEAFPASGLVCHFRADNGNGASYEIAVWEVKLMDNSQPKISKTDAMRAAPKFLLNVHKDDFDSIPAIVNADALMREGNQKGFDTIVDALRGVKSFADDLIRGLESHIQRMEEQQ